MKLKKKTSSKPSRRFLLYSVILGILLIIGLVTGLKFVNWVYGSNVFLAGSSEKIIYLPENTEYDELMSLLDREKVLLNKTSFEWVAHLKGLKSPIKGGRYKILNGMSNNQIINMFRGGLQSPVILTFNNIRTKQALAQVVTQHLDIDSARLVTMLNDDSFLGKYGLNKENALVMFIPNSYELYWNTNPDRFFDRMHTEYQKFWNAQRKAKADSIKLTPAEVSILAAIVDEETIKTDEKPVVAGLYLNRLRKGMLLQADPTIKYVLGNFGVKRILTKDTQIESPYNTYLHTGLPPGPIRIPSVSGIDAVLNAKAHNYLNMCAKEDGSGYHNFAKTLQQHNANAAKYRRELNQRHIYR